MTTAELIQQLKQDIDEVYAAGVASGGGGGDSEFWDNYIANSETVDCKYMFAGSHWNDTTFKPTSIITPTTARFMFQSSDITTITNEQVDFSQATELRNCFDSSLITNLDFNSSSATNLSNTFMGCTNLRVLNYEGTIKGNLDLSDCTLTLQSVKTVLEACNKPDAGLTITFNDNYYDDNGELQSGLETACQETSYILEAYIAAMGSGYTLVFN